MMNGEKPNLACRQKLCLIIVTPSRKIYYQSATKSPRYNVTIMISQTSPGSNLLKQVNDTFQNCVQKSYNEGERGIQGIDYINPF